MVDRFMKRGQMETFGLVIIVIIILFIGIFALQFMMKPKQQGLNQDYLKLQANNLRNSVLKYTLCNDVDIKKEIYNCEELGYNECLDCNELKNVIKNIIDKSLDDVKMGYGFRSGDINLERGNCQDRISATTEKFINSDLEVEFYLC